MALWWLVFACTPGPLFFGDTDPPCDPIDADGDGFFAGECAGTLADCDDANFDISPTREDICNGIDDDCSGAADESFDDDHDGQSECGGDCDDEDPRNGVLVEVCDGVDNDCDGEIDEGFDVDADGFSTCRGDCDDTNPLIHFGTPEVCGDGLDNDCDATTSETADADSDGFTYCEGDCDDLHAEAKPGGIESCDGLDNDCNGAIDELIECYDCVDVSRYRICPVDTTWSNAESACRGFGMDLASIGDATENSSVADIVNTNLGDSAWIGLSDIASEGNWEWSDGTPFSFSSWGAGEPNDSGGEDCIGTNYGGLGVWNDFNCSTAMSFICER